MLFMMLMVLLPCWWSCSGRSRSWARGGDSRARSRASNRSRIITRLRGRSSSQPSVVRILPLHPTAHMPLPQRILHTSWRNPTAQYFQLGPTTLRSVPARVVIQVERVKFPPLSLVIRLPILFLLLFRLSDCLLLSLLLPLPRSFPTTSSLPTTTTTTPSPHTHTQHLW